MLERPITCAVPFPRMKTLEADACRAITARTGACGELKFKSRPFTDSSTLLLLQPVALLKFPLLATGVKDSAPWAIRV